MIRNSLFYQNEFIPELNRELELKLGKGEWISLDELDEMVINFKYPRYFVDEYIAPIVRLEIGPLAQWIPLHITKITSFVSEKYPELFTKTSTEVLTIDAERTFWEKITILHKMAHFPENKIIQPRYARHLYDVYKIGNSNIKDLAFNRKELLAKDVEFKEKFYYSKNAHYETATLKDVDLIPANHIMEELRKDYKQMQNMIYGDYPDYDIIIEYLKRLEEEIHKL